MYESNTPHEAVRYTDFTMGKRWKTHLENNSNAHSSNKIFSVTVFIDITSKYHLIHKPFLNFIKYNQI